MGDSDHRQIGRDSLFVLADLRIDGMEGEQSIRVRNLSAGGLVVWVNVRNIGWTEGMVAWVQDTRFGIAFREDIDPRIARAPVSPGEATPRYVRPPLGQQESGGLRKI
jgi:hypothetical protein